MRLLLRRGGLEPGFGSARSRWRLWRGWAPRSPRSRLVLCRRFNFRLHRLLSVRLRRRPVWGLCLLLPRCCLEAGLGA